MKILICIHRQELVLYDNRSRRKVFPVSTSKYGIGNKAGSNKTPLGKHVICSKIGRAAPVGAVFMRRRKTGKVVRILTRGPACGLDLITTRILRLKGLEKGVNSGEGIDSFRRCIYIHGTPEEFLIGRPASHGCIRMRNSDIVELFDRVKRGTLVVVSR